MPTANSSPAIFIDSHPEEQDTYLTSWLTAFRNNLAIAITGAVERPLRSGDLRLKWYTQDGNIGFKDYQLCQYELARNEYDSVLALPEVRRAIILGYPDQNPYVLICGKNPWIDLFERQKKQEKRLLQEKRAREAKIAALGEGFLNVEALIEETEKEEEKRLQLEREAEAKKIEEAIQKRENTTRERHPDEEEGLISS